MLRDFLDDILSFINSESLTDDEFDSLPPGLTEDYTKKGYEALRGVLAVRESVSLQYKKLANYYKAAGVDISSTPEKIPVSNILIGRALG